MMIICSTVIGGNFLFRRCKLEASMYNNVFVCVCECMAFKRSVYITEMNKR